MRAGGELGGGELLGPLAERGKRWEKIHGAVARIYLGTLPASTLSIIKTLRTDLERPS
jgi:hypothetical protein